MSEPAPITPDNPHVAHYPVGHPTAWHVVYWRDGAAAGPAGATSADLEHFIPGHGFRVIWPFDLPADATLLSKWLTALDLAHAAGRRARGEEMHRALREWGVLG